MARTSFLRFYGVLKAPHQNDAGVLSAFLKIVYCNLSCMLCMRPFSLVFINHALYRNRYPCQVIEHKRYITPKHAAGKLFALYRNYNGHIHKLQDYEGIPHNRREQIVHMEETDVAVRI